MVEFLSNFDQKTVILIKNRKAFFRKARFQNLYTTSFRGTTILRHRVRLDLVHIHLVADLVVSV